MNRTVTNAAAAAERHLVLGSIAEKAAHNAKLGVFGHTVVVVNHGEEDDWMHNNFVLGSTGDSH